MCVCVCACAFVCACDVCVCVRVRVMCVCACVCGVSYNATLCVFLHDPTKNLYRLYKYTNYATKNHY